MILRLSDAEDDLVAIESSAIMAVSVGRLAKPMSIDQSEDFNSFVVTIVHTLAGPLIVRQTADVVVAAWEASRLGQPSQSMPVAALIGWQAQYPQIHPSSLLPGAAPWAPKPLSKEVSDE